MRRLLFIWTAFLAAIVCFSQSQAFWQSRGSKYNVAISGGGGFTPSCSQSTTFLAAASTVTLTADKTNYDTMICGLVSDGVWNFDVLYIWAAPNTTAALINLANPGTFNGTVNGTPTAFTAYAGYTGDGATFYIDSGFNPTTATSPNFVQDSADLGVYDLTASTPTLSWIIGGAGGGGVDFFGPSLANAGQLNSTTPISSVAANSQGAWNFTRTTSTAIAAYLNSGESPAGATTDTSSGVNNTNVIFFSFQNGFGNSSDQMAAGWIGKGVGNFTSGVNSCRINNRINTYLLAYGNNVYSNTAC